MTVCCAVADIQYFKGTQTGTVSFRNVNSNGRLKITPKTNKKANNFNETICFVRWMTTQKENQVKIRYYLFFYVQIQKLNSNSIFEDFYCVNKTKRERNIEKKRTIALKDVFIGFLFLFSLRENPEWKRHFK